MLYCGRRSRCHAREMGGWRWPEMMWIFFEWNGRTPSIPPQTKSSAANKGFMFFFIQGYPWFSEKSAVFTIHLSQIESCDLSLLPYKFNSIATFFQDQTQHGGRVGGAACSGKSGFSAEAEVGCLNSFLLYSTARWGPSNHKWSYNPHRGRVFFTTVAQF